MLRELPLIKRKSCFVRFNRPNTISPLHNKTKSAAVYNYTPNSTGKLLKGPSNFKVNHHRNSIRAHTTAPASKRNNTPPKIYFHPVYAMTHFSGVPVEITSVPFDTFISAGKNIRTRERIHRINGPLLLIETAAFTRFLWQTICTRERGN